MVSQSSVRFAVLVAVCLAGTSVGYRARGQSVVELYMKQRLARHASEMLAKSGGRLAVRAPVDLPAPLDSVMARLEREASQSVVAPTPLVVITRVERVPKLGQAWFRKKFAGQQWSFVGSNTLAPVDTMMTREVRARMEAHFGKPTRALGDFDVRQGVAAGDIFEFEYWFVVNDSIPVVVTDVNGPFERGVVVSTVDAYADLIVALRDSLLDTIVQSDRRAAYVDYYYDDEQVQWYRAGYDGRTFFLDPIGSPGFNRPVLNVGGGRADADTLSRNVQDPLP